MAKKNSREKEAYAKMTPKMLLLYAVIHFHCCQSAFPRKRRIQAFYNTSCCGCLVDDY